MRDHLHAKFGKLLLTAIIAAAGAAAAASGADRGSHANKSSSDSEPDQELIITGRDALRRIVQQQCVVNWTQKHDPAPCERVFLPDSKTERAGYAVLADRKGGAHYLLIPTQTMVGIDSEELLDPDLPNYFAEAWHARDLITAFVGHEVPRTAIGLAINTAHSRSQDQFHIHIECLRPDVAESLSAAAPRVTDTWSPVIVAGSTYQAQRILSDGLDGSNLFEMLARLKPEVRHHMSDYTLVVAGMRFKDGPGFIVLTGTGPTGELLLDAGCSVAGAGG
ncbi:MAG TPA: CDP-diacylglycerol diphosphatase [Steroidobacteraceae bacterium]|jgi:CDP-diacylglycerol pyrophosphatase